MNTQLIMLLLIGMFTASSCKQSEDTTALSKLRSDQEALHAIIAANDKTISNLETDTEESKKKHNDLFSENRELLKTITNKLKRLDEESKAAKSILSEIIKESEDLKKQMDERVSKPLTDETGISFCGNGPWMQWPKQIKKSNKTLELNAALTMELKRIAESLKDSLAE